MIDLNEAEKRAIDAAMEMGGEYVGNMPTQDMAKWDEKSVRGLVEVIVGGYVDSIINQQIQALDALRKVAPHS